MKKKMKIASTVVAALLSLNMVTITFAESGIQYVTENGNSSATKESSTTDSGTSATNNSTVLNSEPQDIAGDKSVDSSELESNENANTPDPLAGNQNADNEVSASSADNVANSVKKIPEVRSVDVNSFIKKNSAEVVAIATANDLYPSVMMAQAILESASGTSELCQKSNNLFGIKYTGVGGVENVDYVLHNSYEYISGESKLVESKFRKYNSFSESFLDYAKKIHSGTPDKPNRYAGVFRSNAQSYQEAIQGLYDGGYATSPDYVTSLNAVVSNWQLQKLDLGTIYSIDNVGINNRVVGGKFNIRGWVLSPFEVKSINILANGSIIQSGNVGVERQDVARLYSMYGDTNSGYNFDVPAAKLASGKNSLVIEFVLSNGKSVRQNFSVDNPSTKGKMYLDIKDNLTVADSLSFNGWALVSGGVKSVKITLNNSNYSANEINIVRPDVFKAFPEYNCKDAGFSVTVPTDTLEGGKNYSLEVTVVGNSGETIRQQLTVKKAPVNVKTYIDTMQDTFYDRAYPIRGWVLANKRIKNIDIKLNNTNAQSGIPLNIERLDVYRAFSEFGQKNSGFSTTIDFSKLSAGKNDLNLVVNYTDGTSSTISNSIVIQKLEPKIYIDSLKEINEVNHSIDVRGWGLEKNGFESVEISIDGKLVKTGKVDIARPDVNKVFPEYGPILSGFNVNVDTSSLTFNTEHSLKVKLVGKNGVTLAKDYTVIKKAQKFHDYLDTIGDNQEISKGDNEFLINGWAIGNSELVSVVASCENVTLGQTRNFVKRNDVQKMYPTNYYGPNGNGFSFTIDTSKLTAGTKNLKLTYEFKDGSKVSQERTIKIVSLEDSFYLDHFSAQDNNNTLVVRGWFLSNSKLKSINSSLSFKGKVVLTSSGAFNLPRLDVYSKFAQYNNKNSGYSDQIDISSLPSGKYLYEAAFSKADGTVYNLSKELVIERAPIKISIDSPENYRHVFNGDLQVRGWFLADDGISSLRYFVNGKLIGSVDNFIDRADVASAYPQYHMSRAGYNFSIPNKYFTGGKNVIDIIYVTKNGREASRQITIYNNWTVVIDAGHGGFDPGAVAPNIEEKNVNLEIAKRVEELLKGQGYTIIMTRSTDVRLGIDTLTDLSTRVSIANNAQADLFISIHHDSAGPTAKGITVYYQDRNSVTNVSVDQGWRIAKSKELATVVNSELIKNTRFTERGVRTENFHVMRETNMPAILVEGGFVTNPEEAKIISSAAHQNQMAVGIRDAVVKYIGNNSN